ncbi:MAG: transposase [Chloroflexi bacterium]|nr:transposase [Chloroflexota bacterium]
MTNHVLAQLTCLGNHTVTGLLNTCGRQFRDWSADYRLYSQNRIDPEELFGPVRRKLCEQAGPVVIALDDTRLRKTGRKTHGVKYMRDPMGPPFRVNFILAQRFLQTSMACKGQDGQARMIPVDWVHAPVPQKPRKTAPEKEWEEYRIQEKACRISVLGAERIRRIRHWLNTNNAQSRSLWAVADGSFTNGTVLKQLPENTIFVGRIRADAKLYYLPKDQPKGQGRPRVYGEQAPTPEQLRQDENVPWKNVELFFGGQRRQLRVKQLKALRWRTAGQNHTLQLLVIAPTAYRLRKNGKLLYRKPGYIICSDNHADLTEVVQHYLWRWDIEVNFRDEKTLLGVGDAQVRTPAAVQNVTGCAVAAYAMLLTAAAQCHHQNQRTDHLPAPKWQRKKSHRATTINLIKNLRYELWARSIHFSGFTVQQQLNTKPKKTPPVLESALFYAARYS